jgi:hypothetical protein
MQVNLAKNQCFCQDYVIFQPPMLNSSQERATGRLVLERLSKGLFAWKIRGKQAPNALLHQPNKISQIIIWNSQRRNSTFGAINPFF